MQEIAGPREELEFEKLNRIWEETEALVENMCHRKCYCEVRDDTAYFEMQNLIYGFVLKQMGIEWKK
jgi:hypothetical protein